MEATNTPGFFKRLFMNPLAVRELRVACRSWKLVIILTAYLLIQCAIFAIWLYIESDSNGLYDDPTAIGRGLFITLSIVLAIIVMLVFPAFSSTAIASEHEKKSFDLLLLTPLAPWEIASGKFIAAGVQSSIFLVATVPLFALAGLFGGIDPAIFFVVLWVLILFSIFISFVGVYASSLVKKAIPAVLVTYLFAFLIGFVMLIVFSITSLALAYVMVMMPGFANMFDPTVSEGIYYVSSMTVTCALYCAFLFLSTTNRLKPTSHNKSTGLRVLWSLAAVVIPAQIALYFLIARTPYHDSSIGALLFGAVYFGLVLMVPAVTAPAEAPVPSRRVRRQMEKMPEGMMKAGGRLFFPGSDRGALHSAIITVVGLTLLGFAAWICYAQLDARIDDKAALIDDYTQVMGLDTQSAFGGGGPASAGGFTSVAMKPESELRDAVTTFRDHEFRGYLALLLVIGITLLAAAQVTWRLTLSGISRALAGVLAGLLIVVWLVVPYIAQLIGGSSDSPERQTVSQFSPIHGSISAMSWGKEKGRAAIVPGNASERHAGRADDFQWRWVTYAAFGAALAGGLLVTNLASRRRILARVNELSQAGGDPLPQPVEATQAQIDAAIAAVTAPQVQPMPTPEAPAQPPPDLPDFDQVITDDDKPE
ncbi:MAG: ABC transporter permease [Planctomycetes bacterium]|nr:ABC transporter permease [Planctomycetota bacterium]